MQDVSGEGFRDGSIAQCCVLVHRDCWAHFMVECCSGFNFKRFRVKFAIFFNLRGSGVSRLGDGRRMSGLSYYAMITQTLNPKPWLFHGVSYIETILRNPKTLNLNPLAVFYSPNWGLGESLSLPVLSRAHRNLRVQGQYRGLHI